MRLPDGTILMHGKRPYDAVKAHEYYIRTRHLKGSRPTNSYTIQTPDGKTLKVSAKELEKKKAATAARINKLKDNLEKLVHELAIRIRAAKKVQSASKKAPTASQKSKAARQSKQYRQKHKQQTATKAKTARAQAPSTSSQPHGDPVKQLEHVVNDVKQKLHAAVAHQRALMAATKTAK